MVSASRSWKRTAFLSECLIFPIQQKNIASEGKSATKKRIIVALDFFLSSSDFALRSLQDIPKQPSLHSSP